MKKTAFALLLSLAGSIGQVSAQPPTLSQAASREASRLAADRSITAPPDRATMPRSSSDWSRVVRLAPGTAITIVSQEGRTISGTVIRADETELIIVNPAAVADRRARQDLPEAAARQPDIVTSPRATFIYGRIRIAPDGVFVHERK